MRNYTQTHEKNLWESEAVPPVHQHFVIFSYKMLVGFLQEKCT